MKWLFMLGLFVNTALFIINFFTKDTHSMIFNGILMVCCATLWDDDD